MKKSSKQTIILIHGFRGTHHGLQLIADNLSDYNCIIPDLPGFGEGDTLSDYSLDSYVSWLHHYIHDLHLSTPPVLLGHSFGSIITSAYAASFPDTIKQLVLVNPIGAPALEGPKRILTNLAIFYYWLGEKLPRLLAQPWLQSQIVVMIMSISMTKTRDKQLRRYIHDQHRKYFSRFHTAESVSQSFKTSVSHNVRDHAPSIPVPTLLIAGERDDITPIHKQRELQQLFGNAQLVEIQSVGHLTHYETPVEVAGAIKTFIR